MTSVVDNTYIKNFKPRKNSFYHQGIIKACDCKKLYESCTNDVIIYRSGLELKFIRWCESSDSVVRWASEPICIEYKSRADSKMHRYYPDFIIETVKNNHASSSDNSNIKTTYIVEIKPYEQTVRPKATASAWTKQQWIKNQDKWKYAFEFAKKQKNTKFIIVTEKFFGG